MRRMCIRSPFSFLSHFLAVKIDTEGYNLYQTDPSLEKAVNTLNLMLRDKHKRMGEEEDTTWEQRLNALTHILINPTTTPPLHSQFFISTQIPCYLNWEYPPVLCTKFSSSIHLKWGISLFLKRVFKFGPPETSWRSKCPYQIPPPLILAKGVEEAQWDQEQKRLNFRKRLKRKRYGVDVNPWIPFMIPNMLLFSLLLWNPYP